MAAARRVIVRHALSGFILGHQMHPAFGAVARRILTHLWMHGTSEGRHPFRFPGTMPIGKVSPVRFDGDMPRVLRMCCLAIWRRGFAVITHGSVVHRRMAHLILLRSSAFAKPDDKASVSARTANVGREMVASLMPILRRRAGLPSDIFLRGRRRGGV